MSALVAGLFEGAHAVASFLLANGWRTAALGLSVWLWFQAGALDDANAEVAALTRDVELASSQLEAARGSAIGWETEARGAEARLAGWVQKYEIDVKSERDAATAAAQRAADADAALRGWTERYASALRHPDCAAVMQMRICEQLRMPHE